MSVNFLTVPDKRLSASILESASAFKISNIKGWDSSDLTSGDFGTQAYAVFRNSTNTTMEIMEIDPATIASASITIVRRGLQFDGDRTTEVTANKKLWVKGDTIVSLGTHPPQLFQYLKEYIDDVAISGSPNASTTAKGIVEEATQAELRARTTAGSTSARLFVNPGTLPNVLIQDYVADTGTADAYAIAPTPAIVAYATGQIFTFKALNDNTGAATLDVNSLGVKTIKKTDGATDLSSGDIQQGQLIMVQYDGTNFQMMNMVGNGVATASELNAAKKFGGDGSDGALSISSGTTTVDLGNEKIVIKNYTTISITGTGKLAFSNPHATGSIIILKSQGNVTITSSDSQAISTVGMGAPGGAGGASAGSSGAGGTSAVGLWTPTFNAGSGGAPTTSGGGAGGSAASSVDYWTTGSGNSYKIYRKAIFLTPGSGGGGGAAAANESSVVNGTGGAGGAGGGALYIECGGALNFTTGGIDVSGQGGTAAPTVTADPTKSSAGGGGGGGGSSGMCLILYNSLTANSGTITAKGGVGGSGASASGTGANNGNPTSGSGGGGAAGYGGAGGTGANGVNNNSATNSGGNSASAENDAGAGSGGGSGVACDANGSHGTVSGGSGGSVAGQTSVTSLVLKNTEFS